MARTAKKILRRQRIRRGIRGKISGTASRPRMSVFRSNKEIYVQLIDDVNGVTLSSASSTGVEGSGRTKVDVAKEVGTAIGEKAKAVGIDTVVFDRGGFLYHGRVKALAEAAREAGLVL
jgi:large subunit ribosomal protein L18